MLFSGRISRLLIIILCLLLTTPLLAKDDRTEERLTMVKEQIESYGIRHQATLDAMRTVPRHLFVPDKMVPLAYKDRPLPIGYGQTISQPLMVAIMTEHVAPGPGLKVLEIGTGSGYQAAILAATGARVFTIEIIPELAKSSEQRLQKLGYTDVKVKQADGYYGWQEHAPFDAIIVTAAAEFVPPPLIKQLVDGGLIVIPIGSPFFVQTLMLVQKRQDKIISTNLMPVRFVPFTRGKQ